MSRRAFAVLQLALAAVATGLSGSTVGATALQVTSGPIVRYATDARFEDVRDDIIFAIRGRGLVIDHTSHIRGMLERTGKDLGETRAIYRHAQAFSFCSAVVSRRMMEADPHNIAFCPYVIAVYVLVREPQRVYVAFRRPASTGAISNQALAEVAALLDGIVREAIGLE